MTREEAMEIVKRLYNNSLFLEKDKEAMSTLVPELVESEDERIRKDIIALIELFTDGSAVSPGSRTTREEALAWLEKQKEENHDGKKWLTPEELHRIEQLRYEAGFDAGVRSEAEKRRERESFSFNEPYNPDDYEVVMEGNATGLKKKERNPAEWDELQSEFKSINEAFEDGKKEVVAHPEKYGLCDCEPKPEWGEKDEKKLKETLALIETIEDINKAKDGFLDVKIWLESLPERLVLQPKEEWSKEDGETLVCAISVFEDFAECKSVSVPPASAKRYLKRLKSFRPKPKNELSEEDKEELIFNRLVSLGYPIDANGNIPDYNETFESCKSALVHWLRQNLRKMLMNKRIEPDGIKTETLLKDSYIQAYREGVEDSIRELSLL